jgi:hypothetical protein
MDFEERWTTHCRSAVSRQRLYGNRTIHSVQIVITFTFVSIHKGATSIEERKVLHCSGCSCLWDFYDPLDDWYDLLRLSDNPLTDLTLRSPSSDGTSAGQIYVILDITSGYYKVGWAPSGDVRRRLRALQTASPHELRLVTSFEVLTPQAERRLHDIFLSQRIRGEWFYLSEQDVASISNPDWRKQHLIE